MTRAEYLAAKHEEGLNWAFRKDFDAIHRPQAAVATRQFHRALNHIMALRAAGVDAATLKWWHGRLNA